MIHHRRSPALCRLERAGKKYIGFYTVLEGMMTVKYGGRQKATKLGASASTPDTVAQTVLGEMITESQAQEVN